MTDRQKIDTMHEIRMWGKDIVVPLVTTGALMLTNDDIRHYVVNVCKSVKDSVTKKFNAFMHR